MDPIFKENINPTNNFIPIYKPFLPKSCLKYVTDAMESGWISSQGKYIKLCEDKLKEIFGYKYLLLVNNGTSATYLLSKAIKFKRPDIDKIIVPNCSYIAAYNAFLYDKEYSLFCADIDKDTWNINLNNIEFDDRTAVLVVHNLGNIFNVPEFQRKTNYKVLVVEDNCEGLGGHYENKYSGTESFASSLSFFSNKNLTMGEGGAFCTYSEEIYEYIKCLHGQGISDKKYIHKMLGNNFRVTNIQAAILFGQLDYYKEILERKLEIFDYYKSKLKDVEKIGLQKEDTNCKHSNWMFGIRILDDYIKYEKIEKFFNENEIEIRPFFYPIWNHKHTDKIRTLNNQYYSNILSERCFMIPSFPELTKKEQDKIIEVIKNFVK
jgi:perosamine synthetase